MEPLLFDIISSISNIGCKLETNGILLEDILDHSWRDGEETQPASAPTQRSPVDTSSILVDFSLLAEERGSKLEFPSERTLDAFKL